MLALTFLVVTALLMLPLIPPFSESVPEWANEYTLYLKRYMEDTRVVDGITVYNYDFDGAVGFIAR